MLITTATGIHGTNSTCAVSRFVANLPYSATITKKEYDMGYANQILVLITNTDGTIDAKPIPMEKIGVWMHTDNIQKNESIGMADKNRMLIFPMTNRGGRIKS